MIKLRKALGDDARESRFIATIPKGGYHLIAAVAPAEADPAPGGNSAALAGAGTRGPENRPGGRLNGRTTSSLAASDCFQEG